MSFSLPNKDIRMIGLENGVGSHFSIAQKGRHFRMKSSKHVCCSLNSLFGPSPEKPVKARERGGGTSVENRIQGPVPIAPASQTWSKVANRVRHPRERPIQAIFVNYFSDKVAAQEKGHCCLVTFVFFSQKTFFFLGQKMLRL